MEELSNLHPITQVIAIVCLTFVVSLVIYMFFKSLE